MIEKDKVIEALRSDKYIVKRHMALYVCEHKLYNRDSDINDEFINFIKSDYTVLLHRKLLRYTTLNEKIIEALIEIHEMDRGATIKREIEYILLENYSILNKIDYDFLEDATDKNTILLYKKLKHFLTKKTDELFDIYVKRMDDLYINKIVEAGYKNDNEELIIKAMGYAFIQTPEGAKKLKEFALGLVEHDEYESYMPYMIEPLCIYGDEEYARVIEKYIIEFIKNSDLYMSYFSCVKSKENMERYSKITEENTKLDLIYYTIFECVNSDEMNTILLNMFKKNNNKRTKFYVIECLTARYCVDSLPISAQLLKTEKEIHKLMCNIINTAVLLNLYRDKLEIFGDDLLDKISKVLERASYTDTFNEINEIGEWLLDFKNICGMVNEEKQINKYYQDIVCYSSAMWYIVFANKVKVIEKKKHVSKKTKMAFKRIPSILCNSISAYKNLEEDIITYLPAFENESDFSNCIEIELKNKDEDYSQVFSDGVGTFSGLYEVERMNKAKYQVVLKDVITEKKYKVTDVGLTLQKNVENMYIFLRLVTAKDSVVALKPKFSFKKDDEFILDWIKRNKENNKPEDEVDRFMEMFEKYEGNIYDIFRA